MAFYGLFSSDSLALVSCTGILKAFFVGGDRQSYAGSTFGCVTGDLLEQAWVEPITTVPH
jgi:hypothetical protein